MVVSEFYIMSVVSEIITMMHECCCTVVAFCSTATKKSLCRCLVHQFLKGCFFTAHNLPCSCCSARRQSNTNGRPPHSTVPHSSCTDESTAGRVASARAHATSTVREDVRHAGKNVDLVMEDAWMNCLFVRDQWELIHVLRNPIDFVMEEMVDCRTVMTLREVRDMVIQRIG